MREGKEGNGKKPSVEDEREHDNLSKTVHTGTH